NLWFGLAEGRAEGRESGRVHIRRLMCTLPVPGEGEAFTGQTPGPKPLPEGGGVEGLTGELGGG
ncbi:MAG: hypothetical protein WC935_07930, partial [Thermoleophilia bacterium]